MLICTQTYCQVKFVIEIFRNAVSTPSRLDENNIDILGEKWIKPSVVTLQGIKDQYEIGARLRRHYINRLGFLSENFTESEVNILTIDVNKNILTTNVQLMGMWPAPNSPRLNQDNLKYATSNFDLHNSEEVYRKLGFSPLPGGASVFPIKTFAPENNYFELTDENNCVGIKKIVQQNINKPVVKDFVKQFKERYSSHFEKQLNVTASFLENRNNLWNLCSSYIAGFSDGRSFKKLNITDKGSVNSTGLLKDCKKFKEISIFEIKFGDEKKDVVRLVTSNLVIRLIGYLDNVIAAERSLLPHTKMLMLNADYSDITSLLLYTKMAFSSINVPYPGYSSISILELVKNRDTPKFNATEEHYTVNIFFNDKVLASINYALFKQNLLQLTMDGDAVSDFCGFTDYSTLYFKLAALLLMIASFAIGAYILHLWRQMHLVEAEIYKKEDSEINLNKKLINNEEVQ